MINQGNNTVTDLYPTDLSTIATFTVANSPVWEAVRPDSQRLYVVTQGDGLLHTFQTSNNAEILPAQTVGGPGANFVLYDKSLSRLYVTNPTAGAVYVFDASVDPPSAMPPIYMTGGANPPCAGPCSPVSVTALPDGSRFNAIRSSVCTDSRCAKAFLHGKRPSTGHWRQHRKRCAHEQRDGGENRPRRAL